MSYTTVARFSNGRIDVNKTVELTARFLGGNFSVQSIQFALSSAESVELTEQQIRRALNYLTTVTTIGKTSVNWFYIQPKRGV